ncbi:MAG: secondary thiamine-phosphate synthase enzyme YjbQ [Minisyncoccia bacterium]
MKIFKDKRIIKTKGRYDFVDITELVRGVIKNSEIKDGVCFIFLPHTTAGFYFNEDESGLIKDFKNFLDKILSEKENYYHNRLGEGNAASHLKNLIFRPIFQFIVEDNDVLLGMWQRIFLVEFDNIGRERKIFFKIIGE